MELTIRSWFGEVGIEFKISHKVHRLIRETLIEHIMQPYGLDQKDPSTFIGLVITTTSKTEILEVRGPEFDKRNNFINYGLWLPYHMINGTSNYLKEYLHYLFDALVILFKRY